jgi:cleavage and polyadenylation specificity factor subunit 1
VAAGDIAKTAIITPFGLFEFTRMPFGLRNAGMTFQRLMDSILGSLPFAFVYLDDILVASTDEAAHWRHLEAVFSALQQNGLVINPDKCLLACKSIYFLGHRLSASGIAPLPSRVQAIADFPRPATVKQLQAFLGLFNFYRRFIPAAAKLVLPLTRSLRGSPKGMTPLVWSPAMAAAFQAAQVALSSSAVLAHPVAGAELSLVTDASATHVGAVVQQRRRGQAWRPLGFFSAQLNKAEINYSAFDTELLAVVAAIRHFRYILEGRSFVVFTDHKPLVGALHRRSDPISARQQRHLSFIAEFAPSIRHIIGDSNIVADTLSRPSGECSALPCSAATNVAAPCCGPGAADQGSTEVKVPTGSSVTPATAGSPPSLSPVDLAALAAAQPTCPDCQRAKSSPSLRVSEILLHGTPILVDTSSGVFRPIVPEVFRRPIFDAVHSLAHPGIRATKRLISSRFV